jgi:hypothetical protein
MPLDTNPTVLGDIPALYAAPVAIYPSWCLDSCKKKRTAQYANIAYADISSTSHFLNYYMVILM